MNQRLVHVRYLGPTNTLGARMRVSDLNFTDTYVWNYSANVDRNHEQAIRKFFADHGEPGWLVTAVRYLAAPRDLDSKVGSLYLVTWEG